MRSGVTTLKQNPRFNMREKKERKPGTWLRRELAALLKNFGARPSLIRYVIKCDHFFATLKENPTFNTRGNRDVNQLLDLGEI